MERNLSRLIACLVVFGSVGNAGPVHGNDDHFHMFGTMHGTFSADVGCPGVRITTTGSFDGTPLGSVSWAGSECVDFASAPGGTTVREGEFAFDDDLLSGVYEGRGGLPDGTGHVYQWGTFMITGGSGPYEGAQGGGIFTIVAEPVSATADVQLMGAVDLAA